jgi:cytochrome bd-type quinol oxidase subunit 2
MTGVTPLTLCRLHGATFIALRTSGEIRDRAHATARVIGPVAVVVNLAWVIWTLVLIGGGTVPRPTQISGRIAVLFAALLSSTDKDGWAFVASGFAIAAVLVFPGMLLYQGWSFHVFRARVKASAEKPAGAAATAPADGPSSPSTPPPRRRRNSRPACR